MKYSRFSARRTRDNTDGRKPRRNLFGLLAVGWLIFFPGLTMPSQAAPRQTLHGHVPAAASRLTPIERLTGTNHLRLAIGLPVRDPAGLTNLLQQLYDPASPGYRQYLTPAQFTERFGPTERDYQAVMAFARTNGFTVTATHPNRLLLDVEAPVADIERAFHLNLRVYRHSKEARTFYAPDTEPSLDLAVPVLDISGLDNYSLPHPAGLGTGSGTNGTFLAQDLRAAYVPGVSLDGFGQTVGLLAFDGFDTNDIAQYENRAGLPNVPLEVVTVGGGVNAPDVEATLDIDMVIAMAPGLSRVIVYEAPRSGSYWVSILSRMANDNRARQLSSSWAGGPANASAEQIFQQMAAQGQSFFQASGDTNAYSGDIPFPADSPNVTVVGGTTLTTSGPGGAWASETVWNSGTNFDFAKGFYDGSGGGVSTFYWIPWWQQSTPMTSNGGSTSRRNIPDVAMTADNIFIVANGHPTTAGGTSAAAPLWAGFMALVNQQAAANGKSPVGFLNPALYAIGNGSNYLSCFHDVTTGSNYNYSPFSPAQYVAVPGYDLCTGWGTPAGAKLISVLTGTIVSTNVTTNVTSTVVTDSSLPSLYAALLGGGHITFDPKVTYNFEFYAPIPIVRDTIIDAGPTKRPSVVFSGGNATRLFTVCSNVTLQLINVTLTGGSSATGGAVLNQGGTFIANGCLFSVNQSPTGGAILNQAGTVSATNCVFRGNAAVGLSGAAGVPGYTNLFVGGVGGPGQPGTSAAGGAIYALAPAEFYLCRFEEDTASGGNGGPGGVGGFGGSLGGNGGNGGAAAPAFGGAIYSTNRLVLVDCEFDNNTAAGGNGGPGGFAGSQASTNSTPLSAAAGLSQPGAFANGGAICSFGTMLVTRCTFAGNAVTGGRAAGAFADSVGLGRPGPDGGPALGGAIYAAGTNVWANCTFSANSAQGGAGGNGGAGTVYFGGNGGAGGAALGGTLWALGQTAATNCTFASGAVLGGLGGQGGAAGNTNGAPGSAGSIGGAAGGNLATGTGGSIALLNCIVAYGAGGNAYGPLADAGHNLSSDATCHFTAPGSMNSTDPLLGPLAEYGGPTQTIPLRVATDDQGCQGCNGLLVGSPAIDAGAAIDAGLATDQRGVPRPQGKAVDIGAFECVALVGQVRQFNGAPLANVTITLLSVFSPPLKTVTDAQGRYQIVAPPDMDPNLGVYRLIAQTGEMIFSPAYARVERPSPTSSVSEYDFTEPLAVGQVRQGDGSPLTNVTVTLVSTSSPTLRAVTDAQGSYQFIVPPGMILVPGAYQIAVQADGAVFSPASVALQAGSPRTSLGVDFTECMAIGQVRQCDGSTPFANVTVSLLTTFSPFAPRVTTATDAQGRYQVTVSPGITLTPGLYRVKPTAGAANFSPAFVDVQIGPFTATRTNADFTEAVAAGQVRQSDGSPFANATVWLEHKSLAPLPAVTDAQGRYQVVVSPGTVLEPGKYSVVPEVGAAVFSPAYATLDIPSPAAGRMHLDFASPLTGGFTAQRGFHVTGWAAPGQVFRVEVAPALPAPFWQPLGTVTNGADGLLDFTDPTAWYFPTRFYRLVPQSPQPGP